MRSEITIRTAGDEDLLGVLQLWQEAKVTPPGPTDSLEGLTRLISNPGGLLLLAVIDGRIVGSVIGGWDGWRGNIYRLAVTPAYRRRGIARELVGEMNHRLFAKGADRIAAVVEHEHAWATAFWDSLASLSYQRDPRFVRYIADLKRSHS
jgi:ribosomal protein S18 acetylase RimI-like enzyme